LRQQAEQDFEAVKSLWQVIEEAGQKTKRNLDKMADGDLPEQFFVLIECADEAEQLAMLQRFQKEGLRCQAKLA
jgi:hypothetical protein